MKKFTTNDLLASDAVHFWVKDLIKTCRDKDIVDVMKGLELAKIAFQNEFDADVAEWEAKHNPKPEPVKDDPYRMYTVEEIRAKRGLK